MERTGVTFECQEAIDLLGEAGADVSNPRRVKIPSYLVEQALKTTPKTITIYTRDGEQLIVLNGMTSHFGGILGVEEYLDPYTRQRRQCDVEDIADITRVMDALPNIEWIITEGAYQTIPGIISDKVAFLQVILNNSKPVMSIMNDVSSLRETLAACAMVAGGEKELRDKPFFMGQTEPVTPLTQVKDAVELSLLYAEKGVPNLVFSMPMAGATAPATFPAVLAILNAEFLSHLVMIQLKKPGAPVIYGAMPSIMDMKTTIYSFGEPELSFLTAAMIELGHYYKLPVYGTAGEVDVETIGAQAAAEATYQILLSALSGAELIHGAGEMYQGRMVSPEFVVLGSEIIDMVKVVMQGIEINDETLALETLSQILGAKGIRPKHGKVRRDKEVRGPAK
jgi:trimethylamine--corrinoid protein Co-methyltransferase